MRIDCLRFAKPRGRVAATLALPQWLQRKLATARNPRQRGQTPSANFEMFSRARSCRSAGAANQRSSSFSQLKRIAGRG
jgi:hypothetical protein